MEQHSKTKDDQLLWVGILLAVIVGLH